MSASLKLKPGDKVFLVSVPNGVSERVALGRVLTLTCQTSAKTWKFEEVTWDAFPERCVPYSEVLFALFRL